MKQMNGQYLDRGCYSPCGYCDSIPLQRLEKSSRDSAYFADIRTCLLKTFIVTYNREEED
jgi:hypothetical protein